MRMFVAVRPDLEVVQELADFLESRPQLAWTRPEHWHITLAFFESVPEHRMDEFSERLADVARRVEPFTARLGGAGAFPDPVRAAVLWLGLNNEAIEPLARLARGARAAGNAVGAIPDGKPFTPHLTVARWRRGSRTPSGSRGVRGGPHHDATRWLRILDTFYSSAWQVDEIELVQSYLGEGPRKSARHEVLEWFSLGRK